VAGVAGGAAELSEGAFTDWLRERMAELGADAIRR
jgi:hypothetical protein